MTDVRLRGGEPLSLDEALSILGEETRARIIVELGEAVADDGVTPAVLSFSELRKRVGAEDSGRFNYHLDKLVGTFVTKGDAGYVLRPPGAIVHQAIVAGTLTERDGLEPFEVGDCPDCDGSLRAEYHPDQCLFVICEKCGTYAHVLHFPNRGLDGRSPAEVLDAAVRRHRNKLALLRQGICRGCGAEVDRRLHGEAPSYWDEFYDYGAYASLACSACQGGFVGHPVLVALTIPSVAGFFADHDREAASVRPWDAPVTDARAGTTLVSDPRSVTIPFELGDERLRVVLDDDLQVAETERVER